MYIDCLKCNECGKIYKSSYKTPRYCGRCGNKIVAISILGDGKANSTKVVAKKTLFGWKERKLKDRID